MLFLSSGYCLPRLGFVVSILGKMFAHAISGSEFSGTTVLLALPSWFFGQVFLPYFAGAIVLLAALPRLFTKDLPQARGLDKLLALGPLFFAFTMAVFGAQHFTVGKFVAMLVPKWIPWHLFWTYFIGTALIAAALSIVTRIQARLSASLLGLMLFLFVVLMHIPNLLGHAYDRIQLATVFRDLSFSGGALAFAATQTDKWRTHRKHAFVTIARFFIAIPVLVFVVELFRHPSFVPAVPLEQQTPTWIPLRFFWCYFSALAYIPAGIALLINKQARRAATWLGIVVLIIILFVYLPMEIARPADINNALNYFVDTLAYCGTMLILASALPDEQH
jgi:uncharacterized membrane protein